MRCLDKYAIYTVFVQLLSALQILLEIYIKSPRKIYKIP